MVNQSGQFIPIGAKFNSLLTPLFDPRSNNATAVPRGIRLVTTHSSPLPPSNNPFRLQPIARVPQNRFILFIALIALLLQKIMYFLQNLTAKPNLRAKPNQIRRHVVDGILAVKVGELSSAEPRFSKMGLVYPVPLLLSLDYTRASCFNSHNSHATIRRKQHERLSSTRRIIKRGYAASYFNSQSIGARLRHHSISLTDTFLLGTIQK